MIFETALKGGTTVGFAGGALEGAGHVGFVTHDGGRWLLVADRTPMHPLSLRWPDQPGDHGAITFADGLTVPVADAWTGMVDPATGSLRMAEAAQGVRRGETDWRAVVVHVIATDRDLAPYQGTEARIAVDAGRRLALSAPHTAVHLAALALNKAAERFWTKDFSDRDGLGRPNLDKAAVERSAIAPGVSVDVYRLGKSLRKKGFDRDGFLAALDAMAADINATVRGWMATGAAVSMTPAQGDLDGLRQWRCDLDGVAATIPCGGTHVRSLGDIGETDITLEPSEDGFTMTTRAAPAG